MDKEKRMKIKVNFKPYIPKIKRTREKPETDWSHKKSSTTKNDERAFIKIKDISLLTNPQTSCKVLDEDIIYLEYGGPKAILTDDLADNSISNEPLDLSIKHQVPREDVLPLDLSKIKYHSLLPQTNMISKTDEHNTSDYHGLAEQFTPVEQIGADSGGSMIFHPVISLQPVQINLEQTFPRAAIGRAPINSPIINENPCQEKISSRENPRIRISSKNINQQSSGIHGLPANVKLISSTNGMQEPLVRCQLQNPMLKNLQIKQKKTFTHKEISKSNRNKQTRKKNSTGFKTKQNYEIQKKDQIINQKGMVKINETITSNGGVFCTFRNFASSRTKHKARTK